MKPNSLFIVFSIALAVSACGSSNSTESPAQNKELDVAVCDPASTTFTLAINNPYYPLPVGRRLVLEGNDEGEFIRLELEVLDQTKEVGGVTTRIVTETEFKDGKLYERTTNYFAQNSAGDVCYFGEDVEFFENDVVVSTAGTWLAEGTNKPGIQMPAVPEMNTQFFQEAAPGVAEDKSAINELDLTIVTTAGTFTNSLGALDWNELEQQTIADAEEKFYAPGIGLIKDTVKELIEYR